MTVSPGKNRARRQKRIGETLYLSGKRRGAVLKQEVWYEGDKVVKYSLAYINSRICAADNGRILGYDNSHDYHHRHFMGRVESFEFKSYDALVSRFEQELRELWRTEDEQEQESSH